MFWKMKKPKRKQPVKKQIPKHIADNLKYGESVAEGFKKGVSEVSEKSNRKKPAGKNSEKRLDARKEFLRVFKHLTYRHRSWDIWSDFIIMFACALSNPVFTPYHVCELMAEITMEDVVEKVKKDGYITLNDPCCGAGATLIAGIHAARKRLEKANLNYQNHILVAAQDIDMVVAMMCYIQLSLLGVAAYIKVGNSLTEPMTENDSLDNYWFTMMYFSDIWSMRRLLRSL